MSKPQKILTIALWIMAVVGMVAVLALWKLPAGRETAAAISAGGGSLPDAIAEPMAASARDLPVLYDAPKFALIDQNGKPFTSSDLAGHPYIADFIFTTCASVCPQMSMKMASLQNQAPAYVKLVSFSVDPEHDTPAALLAYGGMYHAEPGRWTFVTGEPAAAIAVVKEMKLAFVPAQGNDPILHDLHFLLVDGQGHVRGVYDSTSESKMAHLAHDARLLADSELRDSISAEAAQAVVAKAQAAHARPATLPAPAEAPAGGGR